MKNVIRAFRHCYLSNYANFNGRTDRRNYWYFTISMFIFIILGSMLCFVIGDFLNSLTGDAGFLGKMGIGLCALFAIALVIFFITLPIPLLSATIRRLKDAGMSLSYLVWLRIVPLIVLIISLSLYTSSPEDSSLKLFYNICYVIDLITLVCFIVILVKPSIDATKDL